MRRQCKFSLMYEIRGISGMKGRLFEPWKFSLKIVLYKMVKTIISQCSCMPCKKFQSWFSFPLIFVKWVHPVLITDLVIPCSGSFLQILTLSWNRLDSTTPALTCSDKRAQTCFEHTNGAQVVGSLTWHSWSIGKNQTKYLERLIHVAQQEEAEIYPQIKS